MIGSRTLAVAAATIGMSAATASAQFDAELVVSGLIRPIYLTHAPGDPSRLFIIQKRGQIRVVNDGVLNPTPFLDLDPIIGGGTTNNNEQGMLGLAFHPDYQNNGYFYIHYTANTDGQGQEDTVIARYSVTGDPDVADPNSELQIMRVDQPFSNHNGGWIDFGPNDGYLYIGLGDGGSANDPGNRAQNLNFLLGKILRVDVDNDDFPADPDANYAIPEDNPYADQAGADEIWSSGLRNPFRNGFDRETGDLFIGDVGQDAREEVDYQPGDSSGGENYGWRCMEGNQCTGLSGCTCNDDALTDPIYAYSHFGGGPFVCAVTGGYVYRGCAMPDLQGTYFCADYCSDQVWTFTVDGGNMVGLDEVSSQFTPATGDVDNIASFGEDYFGEIYICDQNDGHVFKIVPADGNNQCPEPCDADCDMDGELTILDFVCFQNLFAGGDLGADCDGNGELNILDFVCYQAAFVKGCP